MHPWHDTRFEDTEALVSAYDDLPLWSAPFGLALLDAVPLLGVRTALDVGCGTGFPLVELAERLGPRARVVGVDPWDRARDRAALKCRERGVRNVEIRAGEVERLPLPDASFDLVVSNNGLNNVADEEAAVAACHRVTRPGGRFVFTVNLPDTMRLLYDTWDRILADDGLADARIRLAAHIHAKRKPAATWVARTRAAGFTVLRAREHTFTLRYADGDALFRHSFVRLAFLGPWRDVLADDPTLPPGTVDRLFGTLQDRLDALARTGDGLALGVPFVCVEALRPLPGAPGSVDGGPGDRSGA